jgi:hypothetical protein
MASLLARPDSCPLRRRSPRRPLRLSRWGLTTPRAALPSNPVKKNFLPLFGAVAVPELLVLVSIAAAWWFPQSALAASPAECRQIMLLEALGVLGGALVGVYLEIAVLFFPPLVLLTLVYLAKVSSTGLSCAVIGFGWYLVLTFVEGIRAHRGEYGSARENPAHPHRRLDRRFVLLSALAPVVAVLIVARVPSHWAILGTVYFGLLVAVDTVLRDAFDRIPRGILRSFRSHLDPETR